MIFLESVIVGCTVFAGVNKYKNQQPQKRLATYLQAGRESDTVEIKTSSLYDDATAAIHKLKQGSVIPVLVKQECQKFMTVSSTTHAKTKAAISTFNQDNIDPLFGDVRRRQIEEISPTEGKQEISEAEKRANRDMSIAVASFGLSVVGALFYAPFGPLSMLGVVYVSMDIHRKTYKMLREGNVGVDTLKSLTFVMAALNGYFLVATGATIFQRISKKLILKVKGNSRKNLIDVFRQLPRLVWVQTGGNEVEVPFDQLKANDIVVVHAGQNVPVDGTITDGIASIDQRILTGEAQPAEKGVGDQVFASTIVLAGRICVKVELAGEDTIVAKIGHFLNNTAEFKPVTQLRAETMADRTVWPTLIICGLSLPVVGPYGATAILNAHFKYRMGIVAPIGILNHLNLMSHNGILIKEGQTLDQLTQVDTVIFDKTGTLTEEYPYVARIHTCSEYNEDEILTYAAAAEHKQTHPIAVAILQEAKKRHLNTPQIDDAAYKVGYGLTVALDHRVCIKPFKSPDTWTDPFKTQGKPSQGDKPSRIILRVGSTRFMSMEGIIIPASIADIQESCNNQGQSLTMVAINNRVIGAIELRPTVRPEAKKIIHGLRRQSNIKAIYIISGDHEAPTKKLAQELGIDHYFANTLPENKAEIIEQLQAEGRYVCFVGDGINDAIALRKADVSVSLRGASTIATDSAQIVLMDGSLNELCRLFDLAQEFDTTMKRCFNLLLASTIIGVSGVFFLHFGLAHTYVLKQIGTIASVTTAVWPWTRYQRQTSERLRHAPLNVSDIHNIK